MRGQTMNPQLSLSPFGQRPLSLAMMATEAAANACPADRIANKWTIYRSICEAKDLIGVSDRALAVLSALLSFHSETTLQVGQLVVFPSNRELALRAHGMAPATLRRHLALLVDCGLIVRRDSPNGKRYARKTPAGSIERAFGFDLSPLVLRAEEFETLAEQIRTARRKLALVREEITIYRRDIGKMIATGLEEGIAADWAGLNAQFRAACLQGSSSATGAEMEARAAILHALRDEIRKLFIAHEKMQNMSANESQIERLYLNSNTDLKTESEPAFEKAGAEQTSAAQLRRQDQGTYPLTIILKACPDIADYTRAGITCWNDLLDAAILVRPMLGISPSAFDEAVKTLGPQNAAAMIAAILQRNNSIRSPGGYLRSLTRKAEAGQFSLGPVLMALMNKSSSSSSEQAGRMRPRLE